MKKALTILLLLMATVAVPAQKKPVVYNFTEASSLTMVGKLMTDTPNPYHRVDTVRFKGFTTTENKQVRMSAVCSRGRSGNSTGTPAPTARNNSQRQKGNFDL